MVVRGGNIINLAGTKSIDDPEYRYKMPAVFGKIEGSGNGIKTALPNISDVAQSLHRTPGELNKFFGTELGAQSRYDPETDRAIVNGAHTDAVLQESIKIYIDKFVLCPNCNLPETDYRIKSGAIYHKCKACGAKELVDMNHKLCNYILAEEKKAKKDKSKKDKKKDKDKKEKKKDSKKKSKKDKSENGGGKDYIKEAIEGKEDDLGLDDVESIDDSSEAGVDDEGALDSAIEAVRKFLAENPNASEKEIMDTVTNQQMASALKSHAKPRILAGAVLTPQFFKNKEIAKYAPALRGITNNNKIMERHLIAALEGLCIDKPKNFPVMIKQCYDEDILEEETILEWADDGRSEYTMEKVDEEARATLRGEAEPVVVWLQEAESDEESESD